MVVVVGRWVVGGAWCLGSGAGVVGCILCFWSLPI